MRQRAEILLVTGVLTRIFLLGARCLRPYSAIGMLMRTACLLPLALLAPGHAFAADAVALDNSVFVERVTTDASGKPIGRASCRERVCQYVLISVVAGA